jgi:arylformamidase
LFTVNLEGNMARRHFIDLSHEIENGLVTYPGLPAPIICDYLSREQSRQHYAPGTEFQIGRIDMVANTGTYVDSPFHRFASGKSLAELPLESLAEIPAVVIRPTMNGRREIDATHFKNVDCAGRAVLVQTGWSRHWATPDYLAGHPFLTEDAAQLLRDRGAVLVGIDSLNIDSIDDLRRPVHTTLLSAEIPICEHLCSLEILPDSEFKFSAVPVKVRAFGTFPVRAHAAL